YVPNAGHNLVQFDGLTPNLDWAGNVLAAFGRSQIYDKPLPKMTWKHDGKQPKYALTVTSDVEPKAVRLWQADAATKDFRKAKWKSENLKAGKEVTAAVAE